MTYTDQYVEEALRKERGEIAQFLEGRAVVAERRGDQMVGVRLREAAEGVRRRAEMSPGAVITDPEHAAAVRNALVTLAAAMRAAKDAGLSVLLEYQLSNPVTCDLRHFTAEDVEGRMAACVSRTVQL